MREVHASFAANAFAQVASQLEDMQRSERVLRDVPGARERTSTLKDMSDQVRHIPHRLLVKIYTRSSPEECPDLLGNSVVQLEKVLRPQLLAALQKERVSNLETFVVMYRKLGKVNLLETEYTSARPGPLHRAWFAFSSEDEFGRWLPTFHDQVGVCGCIC